MRDRSKAAASSRHINQKRIAKAKPTTSSAKTMLIHIMRSLAERPGWGSPDGRIGGWQPRLAVQAGYAIACQLTLGRERFGLCTCECAQAKHDSLRTTKRSQGCVLWLRWLRCISACAMRINRRRMSTLAKLAYMRSPCNDSYLLPMMFVTNFLIIPGSCFPSRGRGWLCSLFGKCRRERSCLSRSARSNATR